MTTWTTSPCRPSPAPSKTSRAVHRPDQPEPSREVHSAAGLRLNRRVRQRQPDALGMTSALGLRAGGDRTGAPGPRPAAMADATQGRRPAGRHQPVGGSAPRPSTRRGPSLCHGRSGRAADAGRLQRLRRQVPRRAIQGHATAVAFVRAPGCGLTFAPVDEPFSAAPSTTLPTHRPNADSAAPSAGVARPVRRAWPVRLMPGAAPRSWRAPLAGHRPFDSGFSATTRLPTVEGARPRPPHARPEKKSGTVAQGWAQTSTDDGARVLHRRRSPGHPQPRTVSYGLSSPGWTQAGCPSVSPAVYSHGEHLSFETASRSENCRSGKARTPRPQKSGRGVRGGLPGQGADCGPAGRDVTQAAAAPHHCPSSPCDA